MGREPSTRPDCSKSIQPGLEHFFGIHNFFEQPVPVLPPPQIIGAFESIEISENITFFAVNFFFSFKEKQKQKTNPEIR